MYRIERKVVMLFDGGCPLCSREVEHYKGIDRENKIDWVDIANSDDVSQRYGIKTGTAMERLHVIDNEGVMQSGVNAFLALWDVLPGYRYIARLIRILRVQGVLEWFYGYFARWRIKACKMNSTCQ